MSGERQLTRWQLTRALIGHMAQLVRLWTLPGRFVQLAGKRPLLQQHRIQVGAATIAYQTGGHGPPLVLVHGLVGSTRWWRHNIDALAAHFQLYMIDLIGFGASRCQQQFMLPTAADQLADWMGLVGITHASVIGHSMGGVIAADLAAARPDLVDRLVLVNTPVLPFDQVNLQHVCGLLALMPSLRLDFLPVLATDAWRAGPTSIAQATQQLLAVARPTRLADIQAPTALIWGACDTLVPLRMGSALARQLPGAYVVVIAGAGHNPMWEQPQAFNRAALAFLLAPRSRHVKGEQNMDAGGCVTAAARA